jgi:hypothetical protein
MRRVIFGASLLLLSACTSAKLPVGTTVSYPAISHRLTATGTLPGVALQQGQLLEITIKDTIDDCFTYNTKVLTDTDGSAGLLSETPDSVTFEIMYDETFSGYEIEVARRADSDDKGCDALAPATWTIPVLSNWRVAMSGAVTFDQLTEPVYFLEPGSQTQNGQNVVGFFVRRDKDGEDLTRTAAGTMAHLYNTNWGGWVPLTFGVSLAQNPTYLVGTGVRLGQQGHLTIGAAIGPRGVLPSHLREGSFVTDANAINTLGSRNDVAMFVAVSLSFFEKNLGKLSGLIKPAS